MLQRHLLDLFSDFQRRPREFFHERELHAHLYSLAREPLGTLATSDGVEIHRLRYEYDSIWRYVGDDGYKARHSNAGKTCNLDFAILRDDFVKGHDHLDIVNKDETRRKEIRSQAEDEDFSPAIDAAIEFKMAFVTRNPTVGPNEIGLNAILQDCRKLAQERVRNGYILVFSHGPSPDERQAQEIITACNIEFAAIHPKGTLNVYVVTPTDIFESLENDGETCHPSRRDVCRQKADDKLVVVVNPGSTVCSQECIKIRDLRGVCSGSLSLHGP